MFKSKRPEYQAWMRMRQRCNNPSDESWPHYGGRGIRVCERWQKSFAAFFSDMGERPSGRSLDRINNDGNYEPGNCRWATSVEQSRNTRQNIYLEFRGQRKLLKDWAKESGVNYETLRKRVRNGCPEDILLIPAGLTRSPVYDPGYLGGGSEVHFDRNTCIRGEE